MQFCLLDIHISSLVTRRTERNLPARADMDWTTKMHLFRRLSESPLGFVEAGKYVRVWSEMQKPILAHSTSSSRPSLQEDDSACIPVQYCR